MNLPPKQPPSGLALIHETSAWPHWPFLPMSRLWGHYREHCVLTVTSHGYCVSPGNYATLSILDAQFTPCDPAQLLKEGWEVD